MRPVLIAVSALLLLSACGGGGGDSGTGGPGSIPGSAQRRDATRDDGSVSSLPNASGGFTATRTVTLSNDDAGASAAVVNLLDQVGSVSSSASVSGYQVQVVLAADAPSDAEARAALDSMSVRHVDAVGGSTLYLENEVEFAQHPQDDVNRRATVSATLPPALSYRLYQRTGVGGVQSSGLSGASAGLDTGVGDADLSGTWEQATLSSGTGSITLGAGTRSAQLDTGVGSVDAAVATGASYDLEGRTGVGTVNIVVPGTEPVGEPSGKHAHYRSPDYGSSNNRVSVEAQTGVGDVTIHH